MIKNKSVDALCVNRFSYITKTNFQHTINCVIKIILIGSSVFCTILYVKVRQTSGSELFRVLSRI